MLILNCDGTVDQATQQAERLRSLAGAVLMQNIGRAHRLVGAIRSFSHLLVHLPAQDKSGSLNTVVHLACDHPPCGC